MRSPLTAIGHNEQRFAPAAIALGILGVFVACTDTQGPSPRLELKADQSISCEVIVASRQMTCDPTHFSTTAGMMLNLNLGGANGSYVQLTSSGSAYSGTTFTSSVTVQNRTAQPMGTSDGANPDPNGVRVWFNNNPTVTSGSGTVSVNADGQASFTGSGQYYYQYSGILAPGATSAAKPWSFTVSNTVTRFDFTVLVNAKLPDEGGILRWMNETDGSLTADLNDISEANGDIWAVGVAGTIRQYNGSSWTSQTSPVANVVLHGVEMYAGTPVTGLAVGDNSTILKYDGTNWATLTTQAPTGGSTFMALCKISSTDSYIVGFGGLILHSTDGAAHFNQETSSTSTDLYACGGPVGDIYVTGLNGLILHSTGNGTWTAQTSGTTNALRAMVWFGNGSGGLSDMWLTGGTIGSPGIMLRSPGNGTWTPVAMPGQPVLRGLRATGPSDILAVGTGGVILHYNGNQWSEQGSGTATQINHSVYRSVTGGREWWVVGNSGTVLHGTK